MGGAHLHVWLGIVENLVVPVLLGTPFMDKFVNGIFPGEGKTVAYNPQPVPTLMVHEASVDDQTTTKNNRATDGSAVAAEEKNRNMSCA